MQPIFQRLQKFINEFTSSRLKKSIDLFELKSEYWDDNTLHTHIREEIYKASCELVALHEKYPKLHIITNFPDLKNVLGIVPLSNPFLPMKGKSTTIPKVSV